MANRVIMGRRGSNNGLYVSRDGDDVTNTASTLLFDSDSIKGFNHSSHGQGYLDPGNQISFAHGLGHTPFFICQWNLGSELNTDDTITSYCDGTVYPSEPFRIATGTNTNAPHFNEDHAEDASGVSYQANWEITQWYGVRCWTNATNINIYNGNLGYEGYQGAYGETGYNTFDVPGPRIFYAFIVFECESPYGILS